MALTQTQMLARLHTLCDADREPTLTDAELTDVLADHARASVWAASTAYAVGSRIVPTAGNGRLYQVVVAGTSGSTEPTWGTGSVSHRPGRRLTDGTTLVWEDAGPAHAELWDLSAAAGAAWGLKAAKAAHQYDFETHGQTFARNQLIAHCRQMQRQYQGVTAL